MANASKIDGTVGAKPRIAIPEPCSYDAEYSGRALPPYLRAIEAAGGEPVVIPLQSSPEEIARIITSCAAILLPGSKADVDPQKFNAAAHPKTAPADPPRDAADELLLQDAYNLRKPVFGICYGLQSLNVWRTGSLVQHIESKVNHSAGAKGRIRTQSDCGSRFAAGKRNSQRKRFNAGAGKFQPSSVGRCCGRRPARGGALRRRWRD